MSAYASMTKEELLAEKAKMDALYKEWQDKGLKLDMSRGKPSKAQLDLTMPMLDVLNSSSDMTAENGQDVRNYGLLDGIPEAKKLMADLLDVNSANVIVCGNASLNIMFDTIARNYIFGVCGSTPWAKLDTVKFLCPVPGYDRHFGICERFGVEMINVPMNEDGPDMDMVEELVSKDAAIKGIWCVPKYSNPQGVVYSDQTVKRFAALKPAAEDFRIFWDNAYCIHHLYDEEVEILNIIDECAKAGNPDMVYEFASTSKVTFAGAGISVVATSDANIADIKKTMTMQTIGHDKVNQLRHVRFFKDAAGVKAHMKKHAELLRPKFSMVVDTLDRDLADCQIGSWLNPKGGYFVTYQAMPGTATRIVELCNEAGVKLTPAGAPFPYHKDPEDSVLRISPSLPPVEELEQAANVFTVAARMAALEKLLG